MYISVGQPSTRPACINHNVTNDASHASAHITGSINRGDQKENGATGQPEETVARADQESQRHAGRRSIHHTEGTDNEQENHAGDSQPAVRRVTRVQHKHTNHDIAKEGTSHRVKEALTLLKGCLGCGRPGGTSVIGLPHLWGTN